MLNTIIHGDPGPHPPLLIAHGLFGSARNWGALQKRLAAGGRQVIAVDMRNHGDSPHMGGHGYEDMAGDLARVIVQHGGQADVLGHSMGGKAAMALALMQPGLVARLIVADIAPVAYGHSQSDKIAAMRALDLSAISRRAEADVQLAAHVEDPALRAFLLQSLALGGPQAAWRLNLDVLEREMDRIIGWPDIAGRFDGPSLFLRGGRSDYVRPDHTGRIRALFPRAQIKALPEAGHWLHAEDPRGFLAAVETFLA